MSSYESRTLTLHNRGESPHETLPAGTVVGRYRITALIASGGMGDVYRAEDSTLGRDVALKVLPPSLTADRDRIYRLEQEARTASRLSHPHLVAIYDIGRARPVRSALALATTPNDEIHYIAMELVEGDSMHDVVAGDMPLSRRIELLAQVADGLAKAHSAGIVHRDLKPENVMVSREGYAKVVDFGLAKLVEPIGGWNPIGADSPTMRALTGRGELIGTAGYMAPEQVSGKPVDQRADIFAFGCILYELVAKKKPFEAETFVDTLHLILHAEPAPLTRVVPDVPMELQKIADRCLAKDREQRFQTIHEVANALRAVAAQLDSEPPVLVPRRLRRAASYAAIGLLLIAAVAAAIVFAVTQRRPQGAAPSGERAAFERITSSGGVWHAAVSPDERYLAYVSHDEKGSAIHLLHVPTGSSVIIAAPEKQVHYAGLAFSNDGDHILATRYDNNVYADIVEIPVLGGSRIRVAHDADSAVTLRGDGHELAFLRDDWNKRVTQLLVTKRDGSAERELARFDLPVRTLAPSWSPDGKTIVVARQSELHGVSTEDGTVARVALKGWSGWIRSTTWSRDGDAVIVAAVGDRSTGNAQILRVAWPSGKVTPLTDDGEDFAEPHIGATTNAITALRIKRQSNVHLVGRDGDQMITRGIDTADGLGGAIATGDGRIIYTSSAAGSIDLWISPVSGVGARRLTSQEGSEVAPRLTPDGRSLVYILRGPGGTTIWTQELAGGAARQLTRGPMDFDFAITPDSKQVVYSTVDQKAGGAAIEIVPLDGGIARRITTSGVTAKDLGVTPDGKDVVFTSYEDSMLRVFRVPLAGGKPGRLSTTRATAPAISPDGRSVATTFDYSEMATAAAGILPIGGGSPLKVLRLQGWRYRWTPDGKSLIYTAFKDGSENVFRVDLGGGPPRQLTTFGNGKIANFCLLPDGSLLVTHYRESSDAVRLRASA